jgi:hypothetical protein
MDSASESLNPAPEGALEEAYEELRAHLEDEIRQVRCPMPKQY